MSGWAELVAQSNSSFLQGASFPEELIERASQLGYHSLALVDWQGVYGLPRAYESWRNIDPSSRTRLICGVTLPTPSGSLSLLASNRASYGLMCRLITEAFRVTQQKSLALLTPDLLHSHRDRYPDAFAGLIAYPHQFIDVTREWVQELQSYFADHVGLPLLRCHDGFDALRTQQTLSLARATGVRFFATQAPQYHERTRAQLHDLLHCVRTQCTLEQARLLPNDERHLQALSAIRSLFEDQPQAIAQSLSWAERCTFELSELRYVYPSEWIPEQHTAQSYLSELVWQGARERYAETLSDQHRSQILHELALIEELRFADYFLTVYDIVRFARSQNILCQGRGSAANSVVCYCLGITAVDPIRLGLLFERFISRERGEPPDIDVDFEHERREEVIQYIYRRYGRDRAAMVAAVVRYQGRRSFLEFSKAMGIEVGVRSEGALRREWAVVAGERAHLLPEIDRLSEAVSEFPRHLSIHSGGLTLSATPLCEIVPIEPARMVDRTIIQWDKNDLDALGLLKIDCLSLGALSAVHRALNQVGLELHRVPHDDPATYQMIQQGETEGTFQIESRAQKASIVRTLPANYEDLVVQVAIVRPGPTVGQMVHPYIERRTAARLGRPYRLPDPRMESILGRTYGVPIFQEQIMKIAIEFADFSPGEADRLRRAIAAWRSAGSVNSLGERLRLGLLERGVPTHYAQELFSYLKGFSEYGFPESHAASFAWIAYVTAYLKCHYPAAYLAALINSQPMGFYSVDTLIRVARRQGVDVLDLDLNSSLWEAECLDPKSRVRLGWNQIRGLSREVITPLLRERERRPFASLGDVFGRVFLPSAVWSGLALAGAFRTWGHDERSTLWQLLKLERHTPPSRTAAQLGLFDQSPDSGAMTARFDLMSRIEQLGADFSLKGYSLHDHLIRILRSQSPTLPQLSASALRERARGGECVRYLGLLLVLQRPPPAKGMAFLTLEDDSGTLDVAIPPAVFENHREILRTHRVLVVVGRVQRRDRSFGILAESFEAPLEATPTLRIRPIHTGQHPRALGRSF